MTSGVVSTRVLDEAGAEGTAETSSDVSVEDEDEDTGASGSEGLPVPVVCSPWVPVFCGVCVTVIDWGSGDELDVSCSL